MDKILKTVGAATLAFLGFNMLKGFVWGVRHADETDGTFKGGYNAYLRAHGH
jgi:threonine/homoserine/homoserine lactone efflux protein